MSPLRALAPAALASPLRRHGLAAAAAALALAALPGCSTLGGGDKPAELSGRIAVKVDAEPVRNLTAAFELAGTSHSGQLNLSTPLGTLMARALWRPGQAELVTTEGRTPYPDLDALAEQALGERVPIAALFDWLRGRPWREAASQPLEDGSRGFLQLGWRIDLARLDEGWVEARRPRQGSAPAVTVRARLDR